MHCPVCLEKVKAELVEKVQNYHMYKCPFCDVIFADPMKGPGVEWYESTYISFEVIVWRLSWAQRRFLKYLPMAGGKLLDVGCGNGLFLFHASKSYQVAGLDLNKNLINFGRAHFNLRNLYATTLEEFVQRYPNLKFDVITFFEVLEHLDNPFQIMKCVKNNLKPNAIIAFSVPNRNRATDILGLRTPSDFPPNHLTRWSKRAIETLCERHGFKVKVKEVAPLDPEPFPLALVQKFFNLRLLGNLWKPWLMKLRSRGIIVSEEHICTRMPLYLRLIEKFGCVLLRMPSCLLYSWAKRLKMEGSTIFVIAQSMR